MQVCELKSDVLVAGVCEAEGQICCNREIHACYQYRWCHDWLMSVREARSGDQHDLAIVRVRSWQQGYAGIVVAEYLASLSVEETRFVGRRSLNTKVVLGASSCLTIKQTQSCLRALLVTPRLARIESRPVTTRPWRLANWQSPARSARSTGSMCILIIGAPK